MKKIIPVLLLIRWQNLLMMAATLLISAMIFGENLNFLHLLLLSVFTLSQAAAGYVINDFFDLEIDKINKPDKVIVSEKITINTTWIIYLCCLVVSFLIMLFFYVKYSFRMSYVFFGITSALLLYAKYLKKTPLLGNLLVSFLCALTPLMIPFCQQILTLDTSINYDYGMIDFFANFAFLSTLAREIIKDIEDKEGDAANNAKTLPILLGDNISKFVAILALLWLFIQVFPMIEMNQKVAWLKLYGVFLLEIPILAIIFLIFKAKNKKQFHFVSVMLKVLMLLGLVYLFFNFL